MLGFQMFLHAIRMVLGNLGPAFRITIPILAFFILFLGGMLVLFGTTNYTANWTDDAGWGPQGAPPPAFWIFMLIAIPGGIITFLWTATAWHRYILLEETPGTLGPALHLDAVGRYFGRLFVLGILMVVMILVFGIVGGLIVGILSGGLPPTILAFLLLVIVYVPLVIIFYRLSPVLPAAATGTGLTLGQAWAATAGASGPILVLAVVSVVVGWALQQPIIALNAVAPAVGGILSILVQWISSIVGISILTTIYGHFVEKRELNA